MGLDNLKKQLELAKQSIGEIYNQNRIFDQTLQEAIKGADDKDKPVIDKIRALSVQAISLAKQGKGDEAKELIKNFDLKNGNKSN